MGYVPLAGGASTLVLQMTTPSRPPSTDGSWTRLRQHVGFRGGLASFSFNPHHFARAELWKAMQTLVPLAGTGRVLDVGCGSQPYRSLFREHDYVGLEFDTARNRATKSADLWFDGRRFPSDDAAFDIVLCSQVLEHTPEPQAMIAEIARVLRPGGRLILSVPFVWDEHEQPYDNFRFTRFALTRLLVGSGFRVDQHLRTLTNARLLVQLAGSQCHKRLLHGSPVLLRAILSPMWCLPAHLLGLVMGWTLPWSDDLYLDHVVLAHREGNA